ncbi:signal-transduction and transcriptional-control protein Stc [Clostridium pasteurianum DSM 525 = ATCC 6013]|uniref:Sigma54 specific transcriptional regulator, Fis family n=1 Tax=Clostridium pasteurianum DSM 525 = ATCC 6013 TaxID=1262449 RepID=A0A0H3IY05_CLOPA|nr:sigma 54-interacting transcriptional regulator [Clostridium pasteurianum]AJA46376.1 signal-transduction and transcriptional-control protein Stc [Clostridium pasteurianum DSM 525 = ATCC 6013]AJA50364.1 signal-transduction and transcriptional-control protein Stc [Clostridium pasteurianum DSM 525 = ATCC 6013]AOZ73813.1 AAA family ATPase [Clostridium pasteurianum DSM 525 = ATCC 6013]AOZ77610.1 AAA family ATPase [Clostridium pasteurianum]ELP60951.1 signal-transduction and transcriptional-control
MSSILKKIQNTAIQCADILSQVLGVDVEIVDGKLVRIAGTGKYKDAINSSLENEGHVYKSILKTGENYIITEPGKHEICLECPSHNNCIEKFEMCTPINLNNQVIGVIGLICFDDYQKDKILSNIDTYSVFLEQISDLISAKASETIKNENTTNMANLLKVMTDEIAEGVVILDKNYYISHCNKKANEILDLYDGSSVKMNVEFTGNYLWEDQEFRVLLKGEEYFLVGNMSDIELGERYKYIFIFNESKTIKNKINRLTDNGNDIVFDNILGTSTKIMTIKKKILKIAKSISTVLITGESGSGKEMFARAIHKASNRNDKAFIAVNCGAIPENLLESELFGYVKGAFTGADPKGREGKFQLANGGTIFLDEIGDMPLHMQVKLLRVIQEKEITKLGANDPIKIDIRIIAATNKNLEELITEDKFREDLYYRLSVIPIDLPPLRERIEDIKILTYNFANKYCKLFNKKFIGIDGDIWNHMLTYNWPGNIRELQNTVEFMINMMDSSGIMTKETLPKRIVEKTENNLLNTQYTEILNLKELEKQAIKNALNIYGVTTEGKKLAAIKLGIGIATLYRKIEEYQLNT